MLGSDFLIALIIRLFGTLLIWAIFFSFPAYIREKAEKFPNERIGIFRMFPDLIVWIGKRLLNTDNSDDDVSTYLLERVGMLMLYTGVIVNLLGEFLFKDEFISALGVEIIGAFIIARTLGLFMEFMPVMTLADFQSKASEEIEETEETDVEPQAEQSDEELSDET